MTLILTFLADRGRGLSVEIILAIAAWVPAIRFSSVSPISTSGSSGGTPLLVQLIFWFNIQLFLPEIGFRLPFHPNQPH